MTVLRRLSVNLYLGLYNCLAFSPDGKTLVIRFRSNEIHIFEVHDLNTRRVLLPDASIPPDAPTGPHISDGAVAFDPSGQLLASAAGDQNVRLWTL
jgi:WD40 repeat protein